MKIERRIRITSNHGDILIEFFEYEDRIWKSMYHLFIDGNMLMTVRIIALMSAWIEHDDANFEHPQLTMSDV
jgi:hypothetical protein